jgi:hypothetical protein
VEQSSPQPYWQFQRGKSGNPAGGMSNAERAARIEAMARTLSDGAFDALSARDRELLILAATLKLTPRRKGEDMVRRANSIARVLSRVRGLRAAEPPPKSFEDELLP